MGREFIAVYMDFPLSLGENDGGAEYSVPDRVFDRTATNLVYTLLATTITEQ